MFSDEDTIEISESNFMRPGDEIISIREVRLSDKFDKKVLGYHSEALLPNSGRNDLDRSLYRDSFYPEPQARFAWTEEDGNIASLVSEAGFGTTGQTTFGKDLLDLKTENVKVPKKELDNPSIESTIKTRSGFIFTKKPANAEPHLVSSTSNERGSCKIDKADPRSRFHYVKYVKRQGRTIKLWECSICGREFQHQYTLMRHLPTHTDERNFHCDVCGKSFRQLSTLSQHRAIHSSDRPYSCEVCAKTFNRVSTLISHRKTHSDEKPYRCHLCPKGFHQKGNLRNHLFTHTNERPYRCNICLKGFNQQSNLVCHKNKTHPEDGCVTMSRGRNAPRGRPRRPMPDIQPDSTRPASQDHCEVSSSVEPYLPSIESSSSRDWSSRSPWEDSESYPEPGDIWNDETNNFGAGVIVDPINTYHMKVALAKNQTPFALLKPENGTPVLVKVVDTNLPNGKQMLVPATADDLRDGGKFVLNKDEKNTTEKVDIESGPEIKGAVQIRVPVVATVVPKIKPCGTLQLIVEEPHYAYHTTLSSEVTTVEPCTSSAPHPVLPPAPAPAPPPAPPVAPPRPDALRRLDACSSYDDDPLTIKGSPYRPGGRISSTCALPLPPPSPTLDLISMDMFDPMDCIPMGPQITAVEDIDHPPPSDDSDIFIAKFEETIPLSDSD